MSDRDLLIAALCLIPVVTALTAIFACELRIQYRESDTRRLPKPGTQPFRPDSKVKPWKKSDDMLKKE